MMKPRWSRLALLVAVVLAAAPAAAQSHPADGGPSATPRPGATLLRLHYVQGQTVQYTTRTVQTMAAAAGRMVTTSTIEVHTARARPDGSADLRMRITGLNMTGPQLPAEQGAQIARALGGMALQYTQDPRGRITARQPPTGVSAEMRPIVDAIMQSMDQMSPQLPEQPVAVGDTWSDQKTLHVALGPGASMDMGIAITYTLRELRGAPGSQVAVIGQTMTISTPRTAALPINGSGQATGEMQLDLGRGVVAQSRSQGTMSIRVSMAGRSANVDSRFENEMHLEGSAPVTAAGR